MPFEILDRTTDNYLAIRAVGQLTEDDYTETLIPFFEEKVNSEYEIMGILMDISDLTGFTFFAMFEDTRFGAKYMKYFKKIATICNSSFLKSSCDFFMKLLIHVEAKTFLDLEEGWTWLTASQEPTVQVGDQLASMKDITFLQGKKFVVAVTNRVHSFMGLAEAVDLMHLKRDEIHLVTVYQESGHFLKKLKICKEYLQTKEEADKTLELASSLLQGEQSEMTVNTKAIEALDIAEGICNYAKEINASFIVVGVGEDSIGKAVLGRVSADILTSAPCSVIVSKPNEKSDNNNNNN
jgi:nucleotide-binding universal stress UspA family protein